MKTDEGMADYFLFARQREGLGDKVALRFGDRRWTYAEVADRSRRVAHALRAVGLRAEERVYVVLPDVPPFAWSIFGIAAAGGVLAMGNPQVPAADLAAVADYVRARVVITTPTVAAGLAPLVAPDTIVWTVPDAGTDDDPEASGSLRDVMAAVADPAAALPAIRSGDHAVWLFTSGSTGTPKAAMHSHRDFIFNTEAYAKATVGYTRDDVTVSVPRLFFGYATGTNLWFPFAVGATVCLFSERPTAESLAAAIERYQPTIVTNVPTMLGKLLDLDDERRARGEAPLDMASVRFHLSAGEALPEALLSRFLARFGGAVYDGIGSAEMFHIYCSNRPGDVVVGSLGRVVDGYELRILPEDATTPGAAEVPAGDIGVLWVRGDSVAHGYYGDRARSWRTFHGHWCRTGDLFRIDAGGYLYFAGRADDLLKVGGVFVAPQEVEQCLLAHPAVAAVCVIACDVGGLKKPKAVVVVRPDVRETLATASADVAASLQAHVRAALPLYKYPREVAFVDELPKNDRGKVDRGELARREVAGALPAASRNEPA